MRHADALLFDFGGTLDAPGVPWKERFHRHYREEGLDVAPERFDPAFYASCDSMIGTIPRETTFTGTVEEVARRLARSLGLEDGVAERTGARFLAEARAHLVESAALLRELSARYRIGIVSNFYGNLESVCRETRICDAARVMVDSTDAGCLKPDARIFHRALDALGAVPARAVFIGDSRHRDMAGARALGMPHILLAAEGVPTCCPGDLRIARLSELREIFA
jgi:putative hydrolase of the HAD superfamily